MPTFTAIALDGLLEPRVKDSISRPPTPKAERQSLEKKIYRTYVSPVLYTTPEETPLPDSPVSFPFSPYIINHKRRGPRLLNSFSQSNVVECKRANEEKLDDKGVKVDGKVANSDGDLSSLVASSSCGEARFNGLHSRKPEDNVLGDGMDLIDDSAKSLLADSEKECEVEDFVDPQDALSVTSNTEVDDINVLDRSWKPIFSVGEYFDAFEELSIEGTPHSSRQNIEFELREIRFNLLMEIEKRKQAEEALDNMQNQWRRLAHQINFIGFTLPDALSVDKDEQTEVDPAEQLLQQVAVARAVAYSVGRGSARADAELEMESHIEAKNFEISRLWDRLHYYEAVNREMSQRNQETVERVRQERLRKKIKQRWVWNSIGLAIALGSAALAWSYFPSAKVSSSTSSSYTPSGDATATDTK